MESLGVWKKMEIKIFEKHSAGNSALLYIYIYSPTKFRLNYMNESY